MLKTAWNAGALVGCMQKLGRCCSRRSDRSRLGSVTAPGAHPVAFRRDRCSFHPLGALGASAAPRPVSPGRAPNPMAVLASPRSFCLDVPLALGPAPPALNGRGRLIELDGSPATDAGTVLQVPRQPAGSTEAWALSGPTTITCEWPERPNALASAARAPSKSQPDARRRRPCRLHAVIRRLPAHGQRDLTLGRRTRPPHLTRDARAPRYPTVERGAGCRRARPRACGGRLNACPSLPACASVGT
jgi:hypothetical protein